MIGSIRLVALIPVLITLVVIPALVVATARTVRQDRRRNAVLARRWAETQHRRQLARSRRLRPTPPARPTAAGTGPCSKTVQPVRKAPEVRPVPAPIDQPLKADPAPVPTVSAAELEQWLTRPAGWSPAQDSR